MARLITKILAVAVMTCILPNLFSCQKVLDEESVDNIGNSVKKLNITARSLSDTNIEFPMKIFVFNSNGEFNTQLDVKSSSDSISFTVGKGTYKVVAISGNDKEYTIPEKPVLDGVIKFKKDSCRYACKSMMMGNSTITIDNKSVNLDITMSYCVTPVEIYLSNIPQKTKKVYFSITPLYDAITFNHEYKSTNSVNEFRVECSLGIDGVWKAGPVYIFPGTNSTSTFQITIVKDDSTSSYSYIYNGAPKPSQPFILKGNFIGDLSVSGKIVTTGWDEATEVVFDINGTTESIPEGDKKDEEPVESTDAPQKGSIWNGCIVADRQEDDDGYTLLLLSLDEWESVSSEASKMIESYSVNGITGWSLPTWEQATFLRKNYNEDNLDELNEKIEAAGGRILFSDEDTRYICYNKDNIISSFRFYSSSVVSKISNPTREYYIRAVKSYFYSNK